MKRIYILLIFTIFNFIAWNYFGLALIVTIATLFYFIQTLFNKKWYTKLLYILILTFIFNVSSTFWLIKLSWLEALLVFVGNSMVMSIPLFCIIQVKSKNQLLYTFIFFWIAFEILHTKWALSWPWLIFGNALGNLHFLVQWYSITGAYGGSIWLIVLGYLAYKFFFNCNNKRRVILFFSSVLFIPILISLSLYLFETTEKRETYKILAYIHLDDKMSNYKKLKTLFLKVKDSNSVDFIVSPEVFLPKVSLTNLKQEVFYLKKIMNTFPNTKILFGVELQNNKNQLFNTIMYGNYEKYFFRTKKKYVPIREYTPNIFRKIAGDSFYTKNTVDDHNLIVNETKILPILCYESIFPSFIAENSINTHGIFLLASEQFMNNSYFGKKQYLNIVRLRAIENKRYLVKCSSKNGLSCILNEKGDVVKYLNNEFETFNIPKIKNNSVYQYLNSVL